MVIYFSCIYMKINTGNTDSPLKGLSRAWEAKMETELNGTQTEKNELVDPGWYKWYLWLNWSTAWPMIILTLSSRSRSIEMLLLIAVIVLSAILALVTLNVAYKNRSLHFFFKMLPSGLISLVLTFKAVEFVGLSALAAALVVGIYANRKRFKMYLRYHSFLGYYVMCAGMWMLVLVIPCICIFGYMLLTTGTAHVYYTPPKFVSAIACGLSYALLHWLFKREQAKGRPFMETTRVFFMFPMVLPFLLFDWATLIPIRFISGKSIFGRNKHDFFALEK